MADSPDPTRGVHTEGGSQNGNPCLQFTGEYSPAEKRKANPACAHALFFMRN